MFDPETMHSTVEWKQARPEDAAIWVSVTRRSADQMPLESEDFTDTPQDRSSLTCCSRDCGRKGI